MQSPSDLSLKQVDSKPRVLFIYLQKYIQQMKPEFTHCGIVYASLSIAPML